MILVELPNISHPVTLYFLPVWQENSKDNYIPENFLHPAPFKSIQSVTSQLIDISLILRSVMARVRHYQIACIRSTTSRLHIYIHFSIKYVRFQLSLSDAPKQSTLSSKDISKNYRPSLMYQYIRRKCTFIAARQ